MSPLLRTVIWDGLSGLVVLLTVLPAAVVGNWLSDAAGGSTVVRLASAAGLWTLLASAGTLVLTRLVAIERSMLRPVELALIVLGGAIAAALAEGGLVSWQLERFGLLQSELSGPIMASAIAMTSLTCATAGALVSAGLARASATAAVIASIAALAFLAFLNLLGIRDGISSSGPLIGLSLAATTVYVVLVVLVLLRGRTSAT